MKDVYVPGSNDEFNQELEKALRVDDFFEIGELMARDALNRNESCGGHFRVEMQTADGETLRDDKNYQYVSVFHKEDLVFEFVKPSTRNYKD